jgi:phospholipid transport system transporter-binding protein
VGALQLPRQVLLADAAAVWAQLEAALRVEAAQIANAAGSELELSAAVLENFDSSALSVLLSAARVTQQFGLNLTLVEAPQKLRELAAVYGVSELLWPTTGQTQAA